MLLDICILILVGFSTLRMLCTFADFDNKHWLANLIIAATEWALLIGVVQYV